MSEILAPALLALIAITLLALYAGLTGRKAFLKLGALLFGALLATAALGAVVWANWAVFIDPPDRCWMVSGQYGKGVRRTASWEDCRLQLTAGAVALDLLIAGAAGALLLRRRRS